MTTRCCWWRPRSSAAVRSVCIWVRLQPARNRPRHHPGEARHCNWRIPRKTDGRESNPRLPVAGRDVRLLVRTTSTRSSSLYALPGESRHGDGPDKTSRQLRAGCQQIQRAYVHAENEPALNERRRTCTDEMTRVVHRSRDRAHDVAKLDAAVDGRPILLG